MLWAELKRREENHRQLQSDAVLPLGLLGPEELYLGGLSDSKFEELMEEVTEK